MDQMRPGGEVWTITPNGESVVKAKVVRWAAKQGTCILYEHQVLGTKTVRISDTWRSESAALDSLANRLERRAGELREKLAELNAKGAC